MVNNGANSPIGDVLIEGLGEVEHKRHLGDLGCVPQIKESVEGRWDVPRKFTIESTGWT